jgi:hypothetical protein
MKNEFSDRAPVLPVRVYRLDKGLRPRAQVPKVNIHSRIMGSGNGPFGPFLAALSPAGFT